MIIVSKCPANLSLQQAKEIESKISPLSAQRVFFTGIRYDTPVDFITEEPVSLSNKNIVLVCGIARPEPMVDYLKTISAEVHTLTYKDHHYFVSADLEEIIETYNNWKETNKIIITTEKDAARLQLHFDKIREWGIPVAILPITVSVLFNKGIELNTLVMDYVEKTISENNESLAGG